MQTSAVARALLPIFATLPRADQLPQATQPRPTHASAGPSVSWHSLPTAVAEAPKTDGWLEPARHFTELAVRYDAGERIFWNTMKPRGRPSFTEGLLRELSIALDMVEQAFADAPADVSPIRFFVTTSAIPGVFNLGGNLPLFAQCIETRDRATLAHYAHSCVRAQFRCAIGMGLPICTIAYVQGDALGGGFECALAHDIIIAERSAKFGLPEVLFNMFPGMGAYSFLSRRLDSARAERIILSGKVYSAEELQELGVVDVVVDDGSGEDAVIDYAAEYERRWRTRRAVMQARRIVQPLTLDELIRVADVWVDAAMTMDPVDLRKMMHLAKAQDRRWSRIQGTR